MRTPPPLPVVLSLAALIEGLFEAVCARYGVFPIRGPLVRFLWKRLSRVMRRFETLAARFAAGKNLSARPSRPRATRASQRTRDDHAFRLTEWVNPKFGWLRRIASESIGASAFAWSLRHLLTTDPEMLALLAATPATARALRPLCWMLGVALPTPPAARAASTDAATPQATRGDDRPRPGAIAAMPRTPAFPAPPDPPRAVSSVAVLKAA